MKSRKAIYSRIRTIEQLRAERNSLDWHIKGVVNSANPDLLKQVVGQARDECPAQSYGLILWSHGTGWLPKGLYGETPQYPIQRLTVASPFLYDINDPAYPRTKTFAQDGTSEMEISSLATALKDYHHDYICFDACLMADIQTYYQMRNACDYIVGSPAEIIDTGFPYDKLSSVMFPYSGLSNLTALCDAYYDGYRHILFRHFPVLLSDKTCY